MRRRISRMRRRMRFRTTAPPSAFFTLMPKRLMRSGPPARSEGLAARQAALSLASESFADLLTASGKTLRTEGSSGVVPRRTQLHIQRVSTSARHEENPAAEHPYLPDRRETMTSLFAASRQHFAASRRLHSRAKAVRFVATAHFWLKRAFRQRILPLSPDKLPVSKQTV